MSPPSPRFPAIMFHTSGVVERRKILSQEGREEMGPPLLAVAFLLANQAAIALNRYACQKCSESVSASPPCTVTGREAAKVILRYLGVTIKVREGGSVPAGVDIAAGTIFLSLKVAAAATTGAVVMVTHEIAHIIQAAHAHKRWFLIRTVLTSFGKLCRPAAWWIFIMGVLLFSRWDVFILAGVVLATITVTTAIMTLLTEFATNRYVLPLLRHSGIAANESAVRETLRWGIASHVTALAKDMVLLIVLSILLVVG